ALERGTLGARSLLVLLGGNEGIEPLVAELSRSPSVARVDATREQVFGASARRAHAAPLWFLPAASLDALEARLSDTGRRSALSTLEEQVAADPFAGRELAQRDPLGLRWLFDEASERALPVALAKGTP